MSEVNVVTMTEDPSEVEAKLNADLAPKGSLTSILNTIKEEDVITVNSIIIINSASAKSTLKKELLKWAAPASAIPLKLQTIQIHFTKCGRFAVVISSLRASKAFALRLASLDPHNQLTTYLLGISLSLDSAVHQSSARIIQLEK